jgi:hypothetical protein
LNLGGGSDILPRLKPWASSDYDLCKCVVAYSSCFNQRTRSTLTSVPWRSTVHRRIGSGQSAPTDVSCSVQITMANKTTNGTVEHPLTEGHIHDVSAVATGSACVSWIHSDDFSTAIYGFVGEHRGESCPRSIVNVFTETMVSYHAFDVQGFNPDSLVLLSERVGEFMEEVAPLVVYPLVHPSNFEASLLPVVATFHLPTEAALQTSQPMFAFEKVSGVVDDCAIADGCVVLQPNVNANAFSLMLDLRSLNLTTEHSEPLTGVIPLDSQSLDRSLRSTMQHDGNIPNLRAVQSLIRTELEPCLRVGDASYTTFESRETFFFGFLFDSAVEVLERLIHTVSDILQNLRKDFGVSAFQHPTETDLTDTLLRVLVGVDIEFKKFVVRFLAGVECLVEPVLLNPARIQPVLIHSHLHNYLFYKEV